MFMRSLCASLIFRRNGSAYLTETIFIMCSSLSFMREATLLKISLVSGVAGLILLFGVLERAQPQEATFQQILSEDIRNEVLIRGTVTRMARGNATQWLELVSDDPLSVTVFREEIIPIHAGDHVEVRGKLEEYNGENQFVGDEVRVI